MKGTVDIFHERPNNARLLPVFGPPTFLAREMRVLLFESCLPSYLGSSARRGAPTKHGVSVEPVTRLAATPTSLFQRLARHVPHQSRVLMWAFSQIIIPITGCAIG